VKSTAQVLVERLRVGVENVASTIALLEKEISIDLDLQVGRCVSPDHVVTIERLAKEFRRKVRNEFLRVGLFPPLYTVALMAMQRPKQRTVVNPLSHPFPKSVSCGIAGNGRRYGRSP